MELFDRRYEVSDEPVPGYTLTRFLEAGPWAMEYWEAREPDGGLVQLTVIPVNEAIREGLLAWFSALPQYQQIRHAHLLPLAEQWLKTADGRVFDELPPALAPPSAAAAAPLDSGRRLSPPAVDAELQPVEVIEIDPWSIRFPTLRDRLRARRQHGRGGIPWSELIHYLKPVAQAVDYLHEPVHDLGQGPTAIIHGGIRPQDVVIVADTVRLADWANLAKWNAFEIHRRITPVGTIRTIAYAAPEVLDGAPGVASDQYSLAILYTALRTAALPYRKGTTPSEMMDLIHRGELDFSRLTKREQRVIRKATALDPEKRWPSCCYLVQALQEAQKP